MTASPAENAENAENAGSLDTDFQLLGLPTVSDDDALRSRVPFELLASQFVEELRQGGRPSIERFARRFPPHAARIREVFPVLAMLEHARLNRESRSAAEYARAPFPSPVSVSANCSKKSAAGVWAWSFGLGISNPVTSSP